jgi:hypothetical protein
VLPSLNALLDSAEYWPELAMAARISQPRF